MSACDAMDRLVEAALVAVEHGGQRIDIERDILGRETKRHTAGGVEIASTYDAMDRLITQRATAPTPAVAATRDALIERAWRYDAAGAVSSAEARLATRTPYLLTGNLAGWTSLDVDGRANPARLIYKSLPDGIKWDVVNTHARR